MAEGGFLRSLRNSPETKDLIGALGGFASAQVGNMATKAVSNATGEDSAATGAAQGASDAASEGKSKLWGGVKGALGKLFKTGGSAKRPTNIYEQIFIGVPVEQAYQNWTEYSKFPEFMKGPESVKVDTEEDEDGNVKETHQWTAKIFLNRRSWKATVEEDVENSRIRWSTEAPKGTIDGAITFTPVGDNATLMIYTLEYRPKGFFEWWGNRWRTVGRRARLDVKHFGRYVMMQDQTQEEEQPDETDRASEGDAGEPEETAELSEDTGTDTGDEPRDRQDQEPVPEEGLDARDTGEPDESGDSTGESGQPDQREQSEQPERGRGRREPRQQREPRQTR